MNSGSQLAIWQNYREINDLVNEAGGLKNVKRSGLYLKSSSSSELDKNM